MPSTRIETFKAWLTNVFSRGRAPGSELVSSLTMELPVADAVRAADGMIASAVESAWLIPVAAPVRASALRRPSSHEYEPNRESQGAIRFLRE